MRVRSLFWLWLAFAWVGGVPAQVVHQEVSKYNHIRVYDQGGVRILSFSGSQETRMSLADPLQGHFEYIDYFHAPWIWNRKIERVLMIGLGGGSIQRSFLHYHPETRVDTVEIDPAVIKIARRYFHLPEAENLKVHEAEGRAFLSKSTNRYDLILLDAYTSNPRGSFIPYQLATREFFELARDRLTEDGVLAYNVMGTLHGWRADTLGTLYRTLREVFPRLYLFPSAESRNVVVIATRSNERYTPARVRQQLEELAQLKRFPPGFAQRALRFTDIPPRAAARSRVLVDPRVPGAQRPGAATGSVEPEEGAEE